MRIDVNYLKVKEAADYPFPIFGSEDISDWIKKDLISGFVKTIRFPQVRKLKMSKSVFRRRNPNRFQLPNIFYRTHNSVGVRLEGR